MIGLGIGIYWIMRRARSTSNDLLLDHNVFTNNDSDDLSNDLLSDLTLDDPTLDDPTDDIVIGI